MTRTVVVAPDSFGGWRTAAEVACILEGPLQDAGFSVVRCPLSDGGEGLLDVLSAHGWGEPHGPAELRGDRGRFVESAQLFGLTPAGLSPWTRSTAPLGLALRQGPPGTLGLGGTGSFDLGIGMLAGLGLGLRDHQGRPLGPTPAAGALGTLGSIHGAVPDLSAWTVLCDVSTDLAAAPARFGPQKGFDPDGLIRLEADLAHACTVIDAWLVSAGRPPLRPGELGAGAAGGLGAMLRSLGARIVPGAHWAVRTLLLPVVTAHSPAAVITGEGRLDHSSRDNKLAQAVVDELSALDCPVHVIVGARAEGAGLRGAPAVHVVGEPARDRWEAALLATARRVAQSL